MTEHEIQAKFVIWCKENLHRVPDLDLASAIPNGGVRDWRTAKKLKAEGVEAGEPDWQWPTARGAYVGLAIEFKAGDNGPSKVQRERIDARQRAGWCVLLCWSWEAAARAVLGYAGMLRVQL